MIPPKNLPTNDEEALKLASAKERVKVERPDLGITLEIQLDASGEEPVWQISGSVRKLETAIKLIQRW
jgi:hypothetical protein